jgi:hypothetical protein
MRRSSRLGGVPFHPPVLRENSAARFNGQRSAQLFVGPSFASAFVGRPICARIPKQSRATRILKYAASVGKRILVIEDTPLNMQLFSAIIAAQGYDVL